MLRLIVMGWISVLRDDKYSNGSRRGLPKVCRVGWRRQRTRSERAGLYPGRHHDVPAMLAMFMAPLPDGGGWHANPRLNTIMMERVTLTHLFSAKFGTISAVLLPIIH